MKLLSQPVVNRTYQFRLPDGVPSARSWLDYTVEFFVVLILMLGCLYGLVKLVEQQDKRWCWTADDLPNDCDVVFAGSSVIQTPVRLYEFENKLEQARPLYSDPVIRASRVERLLAIAGAPNLKVYSVGDSAQPLTDTEKTVKRFIELKKRPRLLVIYIDPYLVCGGDKDKVQDEVSIRQDVGYIYRKFLENNGLLELGAWYDFVRQACEQKAILSLLSRDRFAAVTSEHRWKQNLMNLINQKKRRIGKAPLRTLTRILATCKAHSIRTLVVGTPLASCTRAVPATFTLARYHYEIKTAIAAANDSEYRSQFIDLTSWKTFDQSVDFLDGTHCNARGAEKMFKIVAPSIVSALQ